MKKLAVLAVVLLVLPLVAIFAWYAKHTSDVQSELAQFEAEARSRKMVPVEFVVDVPATTPKDQLVYLSGSVPALGNWDAAGLPLKRSDDGKYRATAELMTGIGYEFKVTRGTWGTVEADEKQEPTKANHAFTAEETKPVTVAVPAWLDGGKTVPGRITLAGDIRLHKAFPSSVLNNTRAVIVYLPPNYDADESARYPVLYLQDGQNLMDESTSFAGVEWKVDETAQRLIAEKRIPPVIVVGIYNTPDRTAEFTPPALAADPKGAKGDAYAKFVVDELKPFIDRTYRTAPDPAHTAIGGASMGALIAFHTAQSHPETFGQLALISPWLRLPNAAATVPQSMKDAAWLKGKRLYIDMGSAGGANYPGPEPLADAKAFTAALDSAGLKSGADYAYEEVKDLKHDEPAFQTRVEPMLLFLFKDLKPAPSVAATATPSPGAP